MRRYLEQKSRSLPYEVTVAMGAARSTGPEDTVDSLFSRADALMYQEKEQMKRNFSIFRSLSANRPRSHGSGAFFCGKSQASRRASSASAERMVRRRKMALRVTEAISAMGKDHHTSSRRPV